MSSDYYSSGSSYDSEDYDDEVRRSLHTDARNAAEVQDYAHTYSCLEDDVLGDDSGGDDEDEFFLDPASQGKKSAARRGLWLRISTPPLVSLFCARLFTVLFWACTCCPVLFRSSDCRF
jgi:hypothetical protein